MLGGGGGVGGTRSEAPKRADVSRIPRRIIITEHDSYPRVMYEPPWRNMPVDGSNRLDNSGPNGQVSGDIMFFLFADSLKKSMLICLIVITYSFFQFTLHAR